MENALVNRPDLLTTKSQTVVRKSWLPPKKKLHITKTRLVRQSWNCTSGEDSGSSYSNIDDAHDQHWQLEINFAIPSENRYAQGEYRANILYMQSIAEIDWIQGIVK
jgi:hypothetical protein